MNTGFQNGERMIKLNHVSKIFNTANGSVEACTDISLDVHKGEIFGVIGFSGAGKSTLIRCINLLERPTGGTVEVDGREMTTLGHKELLKARQNIGMIFQQFNLLMQRTALGNVLFPLEVAGVDKNTARARAVELLDLVGIPDKANAYPSQLSGGQKQRVAIARALATEPQVLLCDEATSALDPTTTQSILALLKELNKRLGITIVIITHEMSVVEGICSRVAIMDDSRIIEQGRVEDVFLKPQSKITRKLIFPEGKAGAFKGGPSLRITFDGETPFEPVIGNMILECGAPVNIIFADTTVIDGKDYGQMVIQLPSDAQTIKKMTAYLDMKKIHYVEEV